MHAIVPLILMAILLCHPGAGFTQTASDSLDLVIQNARLIDGTGAVIENASLKIRNGRILVVTQNIADLEDDLPWYDEAMWDWDLEDEAMMWGLSYDAAQAHEFGKMYPARDQIVIDAGGRTVMPGLIDNHVHLLDHAAIKDSKSLNGYLKRQLPEKLEAYLTHGITTIKSMGDHVEAILNVRDRINRGVLRGPRLYAVGPVITMPGISGQTAADLYRKSEWPQTHPTVDLNTEENARETIRTLVEKGVDAIHIDLGSIDHTTASLLTSPYILSILTAVVEQAHAHGVPVTAYTAREDVALATIALGVDGIEHGVTQTWLQSDIMERHLGMRSISYAPALAVYATLLPQNLPTAIDNLKRLSDKDWIRIIVGSDTFGDAPAGSHTIRELELMVEAGMTPGQVIRAATRDAAEHLGRLNELGTIEEGKLADLIMLDRDPLSDISALRDIQLVIKGGEIMVDKRNGNKRRDVR